MPKSTPTWIVEASDLKILSRSDVAALRAYLARSAHHPNQKS